MSSILTNNSAMVALQTLRGINKNLEKTQQDISTGKSVANARDNAAVWAISKVMESDVTGFDAISSSLNLGSSSIAVARSAAEQVTELLGELKKNIISSQEKNVDRTKINDDIGALRDQIASITNGAQFNGLNLLSNMSTTAGSGNVDVLSSINRSGSTGVKAASITVGKQDLGTSAQTNGTGSAIAANPAGAPAVIAASTAPAAGATATFTIGGRYNAAGAVNATAGDTYTIAGVPTLNSAGAATAATYSYVARDGDTAAEITKGLFDRMSYEMAKAGATLAEGVKIEYNGSNGINFINGSAAALAITGSTTTAGTAGGGLSILGDINVTTDNGAKAALVAIEGLTQTAIKAASELGTAQKRIEIQNKFVSSLKDSLKSGISSLVEADMEESSARLQALQVQQQLGVQALSIANQAPQTILSLFR